MKINAIWLWIKKMLFPLTEIIKDIQNDKKRKSPSIKTVVSKTDDDVFRGFEIEIEEEWLERGVTKYGKWKR